ncbi:MAG: GNAT family N-acetyltransferase [Caldilineaceae bacterium]|nr:GNAT family N-acetyltransferase [Caldilineaceae bacterium]
MAQLEIHFLADRPDALPLVAGWLYTEWGRRDPGNSPEATAERLAAELSRDRLPIVVVAAYNGVVVGTAALKLHELRDRFPELRHWLGGVYVSADARGHGIAGALVRHVEKLAIDRGITVLHLQTERLDGGLYARLGFQPIEQIKHRGIDVMVMVKPLIAAATPAAPMQSAQESAPASGAE